MTRTLFWAAIAGLVLYQLLGVFWGFELCDSGFYLTFYDHIYDAPDTVSYNFMYYLSGLLGGLVAKVLPAQCSMLLMRVAGVLVNLAIMLLLYRALRPHLGQKALLLGFAPNWFTASQADAGDAYANREIIGTVKLGPTVDSYVMQRNAEIPIDLVSLTDEQVAQITEAYPYLISGVIPAGTYDGVDHDTNVVGTPQGCQTSVGNFTQQEQYQIFKAVMEDYADMWHEAYPVGANNDVIGLTLKSPVLLAPGTVQYLVEHGYDVPENLIPPEYVPVA